MAPARPAAAAAEVLEVRCTGCGETLEVEPGLTEFICPDCATPQSLPPELLPPPPPRRKALPLPRGAADVRGARLPCGSCGALLSVPVGLARCACPVCRAELAVDTERLRQYLLSFAAAEGAVPVVPIGTSSAPPILRASEVQQEHHTSEIHSGFLRADNQLNFMEHVQTKRPSQTIPERKDLDNPYYMMDKDEIHDVNGMVNRHNKQRNTHSIGPGTVSVEKRHEETINHVRHHAQVQSSSYVFHPKQAHVDRDIVTQPDYAQADVTNGVIHFHEKQQQRVNEANTEEACTELVSESNTEDNNRMRVRCSAGRDTTCAEKRKVRGANEVIQVRKQQSDSVDHMELENRVIHVEEGQSKYFSCRTLKRKNKDLIAASNSGLQLRRSKRLAKDSPASMYQEPDENEFLELPASPKGQLSETVLDTEPTHSESIENQDGNSTSLVPAATTGSDPGEQQADSPDQSLSNSPDIDGIINNLCHNPSPHQEMPERCFNELDSLHLTTPPSSSHLDMSNPEQFACNYVPPEVGKALAKLKSNSLFVHTMSHASSGELDDLSDSEGEDHSIRTYQNVGTRRNQGLVRGMTLCLKVWTMPKGVRIPVSLNTSGEPIGKEAGTLTNFLCAIARDGTLAPLIYQDWRRVPEKNKDIMCRIVKLKFDIAPIGELWVMKSLGRRWKSWKALLKRKHYNTHETEEERLADQNPRVLKEQWRFLVTYWSTEKAKDASARNKACQANVTAIHSAGTKSFARIMEEERQKRPNKDGLTSADLFILTHTPKNGKPMKKKTADIIARLREESLKKKEGPGSDSTTHNFGQDSSKVPRRNAALQASFKEAMEAKIRAEDEAAMLKKKMMAMEESQKKMQEDLANMKSTVSSIHKITPTDALPDKHV